jgi:sporulation protein YlmC with PRC-barrel domain
MLQSIKQLYGEKLGAKDGEIGRVKDFYFDDQDRVVRYVVVDTGTWSTSRQVLLSPLALGSLYQDGKDMLVNLTRKQIEDSPAIETHKPVSRQYEEEYHHYYGWPCYWQGDGLWGGMGGFPVLETPPQRSSGEHQAATGSKAARADAHLRSTQAVNGYHLQSSDGIIVGHVCDFLMDDRSWAINQLIVKIGHRFAGKEVQIPADQIERIGYEESSIFVKLARDAIEKCPEYRLLPNGAAQPPEPEPKKIGNAARATV